MAQTQHQLVITWLRSHIGEHEVPPHSNTGPFVLSCQQATWLPGTRWPWCAATWVKAWTVAGRKLPYRGAGAYATLDWYRKNLPAWVVPLKDAKPGAAVILNIGAGHLATLEKHYDGSGLVQTIDGNWGDQVIRVSHPAWQVRGCVDPPEKVTAPIVFAKPPMFEVATSARGERKLIYVSGAKAVSRKLPQLLARYGGLTISRRKTH